MKGAYYWVNNIKEFLRFVFVMKFFPRFIGNRYAFVMMIFSTNIFYYFTTKWKRNSRQVKFNN